jgi:2,3-bisphosphoglycerate-independent phosphoglycerate mutase
MKISGMGIGKLASLCGRYYAMDRDTRWDRTKKAYDLLVGGIGESEKDPLTAINNSYQKGVTDEFIEPTRLIPDKEANVKSGDSVIFFNFRPDRARQLTRAFVLPNFSDFPRGAFLGNIVFVAMTEYEKDLPLLTAFPPPKIDYPLAAVLSMHDKRQLHISETEKYAHVTYFLNGGNETPYPGEDRVHIPSPKVATYDKKPEMAAPEITDYVGKAISQKIYDCIIINFANADMVAHTGSIPATKKAIETLDSCLEKITNWVLASDGVLVITGDHGNAEVMLDPKTNAVDTEHTANPVPFIVVGGSFRNSQELQLPVGLLADIAPTILYLLKIQKPDSMTGNSLLA